MWIVSFVDGVKRWRWILWMYVQLCKLESWKSKECIFVVWMVNLRTKNRDNFSTFELTKKKRKQKNANWIHVHMIHRIGYYIILVFLFFTPLKKLSKISNSISINENFNSFLISIFFFFVMVIISPWSFNMRNTTWDDVYIHELPSHNLTIRRQHINAYQDVFRSVRTHCKIRTLQFSTFNREENIYLICSFHQYAYN